jgi:hypothetical protein
VLIPVTTAIAMFAPLGSSRLNPLSLDALQTPYFTPVLIQPSLLDLTEDLASSVDYASGKSADPISMPCRINIYFRVYVLSRRSNVYAYASDFV